MRYLVILSVFITVLFGATNNITFQGTVNKPDGTPYWGELKVGVKFYKDKAGTVDLSPLSTGSDRTQLLNVANGSYSMKFNLTDAQIKTLAENSDGYYLKIYMASSNVANVFQTEYELNERVQILAVPRAFTANGIYFNSSSAANNSGTLRVGTALSKNTTSLPNGVMVSGRVGIGTPIPSAQLGVVAVDTSGLATLSNIATLTTYETGSNAYAGSNNKKRAIHVTGNINVTNTTTGTITGTRVYNARWQ